MAFADDVTIFVTTPEDFTVIREAIRRFEKATGARLNVRKSKALAVGGWNTTTNALDVAYYPEIQVLGINFASTIEQSMNRSWTYITGKVRVQARGPYGRDLCLSQIMFFVQAYVLTKVWHTAQIFPAPIACTQ